MCFRNSLAGPVVSKVNRSFSETNISFASWVLSYLCVLRNSLAGSKTVLSNRRDAAVVGKQSGGMQACSACYTAS